MIPRLLLSILAVLLFVWGAAPYAAGQIDDAFIVFAYAHRVVEHGQVTWNTGEAVEGFSSPLHLALLSLAALGGLDLSVAARGLSIGASVGVLLWFCRRNMGMVAVAFACWQPFERWGVAQLETSIAGLIATVGWPLVCADRRAWSWGVGCMVAFATVRPEGAAWLVLALLVGLRHARQLEAREVARVFGALAVGAVLLGARLAWFGTPLPNTYLVKLAGAAWATTGARQVAAELITALPVVVLAWAFGRWRAVAFVPLIVQAAVLVRAGGDWMGDGRLLLPGVCAAVATLAWERRAAPARVAVPAVVALPFALLWEPTNFQGLASGWRDVGLLVSPVRAARRDPVAPILEDTAFLIENVPVGAGGFTGDVGLPGNLDDVRIWDSAGLTDRVVAEMLAEHRPEMPAALEARYADATAVWCVRIPMPPDPDQHPLWMRERLPKVTIVDGDWRRVWRCRAGAGPSTATAAARWERLFARFPSQIALGVELARARTADAGWEAGRDAWVRSRPEDARQAPGVAYFEQIPAPRRYERGLGWRLNRNGELRTFILPDAAWDGVALTLAVEDPGEDGAAVSLGWVGQDCPGAEVRVFTDAVVALPPCAGARSLSVVFTNDAARPGSDRNVMVGLVGGG